jgi:hypothetical protein
MEFVTAFFYQVLGIWMAMFLQYPWGSHLSLSNSLELLMIVLYLFIFPFLVFHISMYCFSLLNNVEEKQE